MSSDDRGSSRDAGDGDRRRSFTKFIRRTSKILHPKQQTPAAAAGSSTATSSGASPAASAVQRTASPTPPAVPPKEGKNVPVRRQTPATAATVRPPSPDKVRATPLNASHHYRLQEEKARALFAKYNMTLESGDWQRVRRTTDNEWVEKKPRLRVHRQCHNCQVGFGREKVCQNCSHTRCKKCPRYPDKSLRDHAKFPHAVTVDPDPRYKVEPRRATMQLTMEGKHGQELIRKHPVHRVRRTCHRCETLFVGKATQCATCQHVRCPQCPREPYVPSSLHVLQQLTEPRPKSKKYPNGYPGDTPETFPLAERHYRHVRHRVHWECDQCNAFFGSHDKACPKCQHPLCEHCKRHPPKKVKKEVDPEVVKRLEAKMQSLAVTPAAA